MNYPSDAATVERDETWVQQLEAEQKERFEVQAQVMYEEYLAALAEAGPFASPEIRQGLEKQYDQHLAQMKQIQQDELEQHIEMEQQERLWSLGQQDPMWEDRVSQSQEGILAQIRRDQGSGGSIGEWWNMSEKIWENQQEGEDSLRRSEEWQKTEPQRFLDRQQWAERTRLTNLHVAARRERDRAEFEAHAAEARAREDQSARLTEEARQGAATIRARTSYATINTEFDTARRPFPVKSPVSESSSRSSVNESIFGSSPTADTAASSVANDRWTPSDTQSKQSTSRASPIPTPAHEDLRRSTSGAYSGSSSSSRARPVGTSAQPSPLSGAPLSNTTEQPRAKVWIPPDTAREPGSPSRRTSTQFDGNRDRPAKKTSMLFGESPGPPLPVPLGESSIRNEPQQPRQVPTTRTQSQASQSQPTHASPSSQPPLRPPGAPGIRVQPLPNQSLPNPQSGSPSASRPSFSTLFRESKSHTGAKVGSSPANPGDKPTPVVKPTSPEEYRAKMRADYVQKQEDRVEEERRRREQEANERRAEDARRRGAEKRRQEEQAREAERREAERKTRKTSINSIRPVSDLQVPEIWNAYEKQWEAMVTATQLRFRSIPWPMLAPISSPDMLLPIHIAAFILNPQHSQGKSRKDRLREALLRWHPDRFEAKWLKKVVEEERERVQEGVGCVVRALNDLLSAEGTFAA